MTRGKLIQGGTSNRKISALKEALAGGYDLLFLFPDRDGYYDARPFGYKKTSVIEDFGTHEAMSKCKVVPVPLHDIVEGRPWEEMHLSIAWSIAFYINMKLEAGATVGVACTAGKNRSMSMQYAVNPSPYHRSLVQCSLMRRWAEAFQESVRFHRGKIPEGLYPLVAGERTAKERVANPFDATGRVVSPATTAATASDDETPEVDVPKPNVAALQERIRARDMAVRAAVASPIKKRR